MEKNNKKDKKKKWFHLDFSDSEEVCRFLTKNNLTPDDVKITDHPSQPFSPSTPDYVRVYYRSEKDLYRYKGW